MNRAVNIGRAHQQRMHNGVGRGGEARLQIVPAIRSSEIQQCRDACRRSAFPTACSMQRLQHQPIAAERNHHIGIQGIVIAISFDGCPAARAPDARREPASGTSPAHSAPTAQGAVLHAG